MTEMMYLQEPKLAQAVHWAAVRATLAPSVHNTQPWWFVLRGSSLEIHADWNRRLRVLDPRGRQLLISCGCALFNARVALTAAGYEPIVERFPDPAQLDLLARLTLGEPHVDKESIGQLDPVIDERHTNRRPFTNEPTPPDVVAALVRAAASEGAELFPITRLEHRLATGRLCRQADQLENADPAYRAELRAWTDGDSRRRDGVPSVAVPNVNPLAQDDLPVRDFDIYGAGGLGHDTRSSTCQCLLLLGTRQESPAAWLQAGEALERVLLRLTQLGLTASLLTQVIEVPATNSLLRQELQLTMHPHVLLRVGHAAPTPASRRRRLMEVFQEG